MQTHDRRRIRDKETGESGEMTREYPIGHEKGGDINFRPDSQSGPGAPRKIPRTRAEPI